MPRIPHLALRPASPSDFLVLATWVPDAAACLRWAGPKVPFPFAPDALGGLLEFPDRASRGFWEEGTSLVGFGQYWVREPGSVHLGRILVAPEARGRGLGRELCRCLMAEAVRATGASMVTLRVYRDNLRARALYASLGFRPGAAAPEADPILLQADAWSEPD